MAIRIERDRYTGVAQAFADYLGMTSCLEHPRIMSVAKIVKSHTVKIDSSYDRGEGVHYFLRIQWPPLTHPVGMC